MIARVHITTTHPEEFELVTLRCVGCGLATVWAAIAHDGWSREHLCSTCGTSFFIDPAPRGPEVARAMAIKKACLFPIKAAASIRNTMETTGDTVQMLIWMGAEPVMVAHTAALGVKAARLLGLYAADGRRDA